MNRYLKYGLYAVAALVAFKVLTSKPLTAPVGQPFSAGQVG